MIDPKGVIRADFGHLADGVLDTETDVLLPYTHALYRTTTGSGGMVALDEDEARAIQIELSKAAHEGRPSVVVMHPAGGSEALFIGTIIEFQRVTDKQADDLRAKAASEEAEDAAAMTRAMLLGQRPGRRR